MTTLEGLTVFITDFTYSGNLGGLSGAHAICQSDADAAGLSGSYKAWLSIDSDNEPRDYFTQQNSGRPYVLVNGTFVADDWADLTDGNINAPININQNGGLDDFGDVWTNTNTNGGVFSSNNDCSDWESTSGNAAYFGESEDTNSSGSSSVVCSSIPAPTVQFTATTYNGNLGGISGATAKCQSEFSGSYFCTQEGFLKAGVTVGTVAWYNQESSSYDYLANWNSSSNGYYGATTPLASYGGGTTTRCDAVLPLACCSE